MNDNPLWRRALAELVGTGALVATVVGAGIAAERLTTDVALQLFVNSTVTGLGLAVLIVLLGPVSRAHFNPVVSLADAAIGRQTGTGLPLTDLAIYAAAQIAGGIGGAVVANLMYSVPTTLATTDRVTPGTILGEIIATAGLVLVIAGLVRLGHRATIIGPAVGAYIAAAYWVTSSTSFANPAVTIGRLFSDTFAGIGPESVLPFIGAQLAGGVVGVALTIVLFPRSTVPHTAPGAHPTPVHD